MKSKMSKVTDKIFVKHQCTDMSPIAKDTQMWVCKCKSQEVNKPHKSQKRRNLQDSQGPS